MVRAMFLRRCSPRSSKGRVKFLELAEHLFGNAYSIWFRHGFETRSHVNAITVQVAIARNDSVTEVDANAQLKFVKVVFRLFSKLGQSCLKFHGAEHCLNRTGKLD